MPAQDDRSMRMGYPGFVSITGPDTLEYPEYDGNNMYRSLGNILGNPNVGLLFVRLDGKTFCTTIRGKATIHDNAEILAKHHGAKVVMCVQCEVLPNCPRYVPDLMSDLVAVPAKPIRSAPPRKWKSRDYLKDSLSKYEPHALECVAVTGRQGAAAWHRQACPCARRATRALCTAAIARAPCARSSDSLVSSS
jgi:uncharacterized protein